MAAKRRTTSPRKITSFQGKYSFLSNFHPCPMTFGPYNLAAKTAEHAYQAMKAQNEADARWVSEPVKPGTANKRGRSVPPRPDWDTAKLVVMEQVLRVKFAPGTELAAKLLATGDKELVEGNEWSDQFWGSIKGLGQNHMGKLLMKVRADLQGQQADEPAKGDEQPVTKVASFRGRYAFLSNFHPAPVQMDEHLAPTSEHAYQMMKCANDEEAKWILSSPNPVAAKKRSKKVKVRAGWDGQRVGVMLDILRKKFAPGSALATKLLATGDAILEEGNRWGDRFWGVCKGTGENHLGKLLMQVRSELVARAPSTGHSPTPEEPSVAAPRRTLEEATINGIDETIHGSKSRRSRSLVSCSESLTTLENRPMAKTKKKTVTKRPAARNAASKKLTPKKTAPKTKPDVQVIRFYMKGPKETAFLSNFYPSPFTVKGVQYKSNEHFFQSAKALDSVEALWVRDAPDALESKRRGRKVRLRPDWDTVKLDIMAEGIWAKFTQNPDLKAKLLATGDAILGESPRAFRGKGANTGKAVGGIIMEVREKLRHPTNRAVTTPRSQASNPRTKGSA